MYMDNVTIISRTVIEYIGHDSFLETARSWYQTVFEEELTLQEQSLAFGQRCNHLLWGQSRAKEEGTCSQKYTVISSNVDLRNA
mgnify:CR=1 FL=1